MEDVNWLAFQVVLAIGLVIFLEVHIYHVPNEIIFAQILFAQGCDSISLFADKMSEESKCC